jgi:hypothetical protein
MDFCKQKVQRESEVRSRQDIQAKRPRSSIADSNQSSCPSTCQDPMEGSIDTAGIQSGGLDECKVVLLGECHRMLCWYSANMPEQTLHKTRFSGPVTQYQDILDPMYPLISRCTHLRSLLFPTSMTTIAWSACSLNSFSHRSTLSKDTLCATISNDKHGLRECARIAALKYSLTAE